MEETLEIIKLHLIHMLRLQTEDQNVAGSHPRGGEEQDAEELLCDGC